MTQRRVLVTGGAGFIGSNIVAELAGDPSLDVVVCDRLRGAALGKWRNLSKHAIADFISPDDLWTWLSGPGGDVEAIIHMGAISSTTEADADKIIATNFALSRDLYDWCAAKGRRLIWASSGATYGDGEAGFDDDQDLAALAALRPLNAYGWSKSLFDLYAAREGGRGRAPRQWAGVKFFNVYGPNEAHKEAMRSVVSQIWPDVAARSPVKLFRSYRPGVADGGQQRDFIYVRDAAKVVAWLFRHGEVNGVFNLGSGVARSFEDLAKAVFKAAGTAPRIDYIEMAADLRDRYSPVISTPGLRAKERVLRAAGCCRGAFYLPGRRCRRLCERLSLPAGPLSLRPSLLLYRNPWPGGDFGCGWRSARVALAATIIAALLIWRDDILEALLDPQVPYTVYKPPPAPDYAKAGAWDQLPGAAAPASAVDVFFVHPTTFDGGKNWNGPINSSAAGLATLRPRSPMAPNYAAPFARAGRVFAPRYRQASLYTSLTVFDDAIEAREFAYGDVRAAIDYYLAHLSAGRPFILVGVEQGGQLAARLLREEIAANLALKNRLVAAYLIETVVPAAVPRCLRCAQRACAKPLGGLAAWSPGSRRGQGIFPG